MAVVLISCVTWIPNLTGKHAHELCLEHGALIYSRGSPAYGCLIMEAHFLWMRSEGISRTGTIRDNRRNESHWTAVASNSRKLHKLILRVRTAAHNSHWITFRLSYTDFRALRNTFNLNMLKWWIVPRGKLEYLLSPAHLFAIALCAPRLFSDLWCSALPQLPSFVIPSSKHFVSKGVGEKPNGKSTPFS